MSEPSPIPHDGDVTKTRRLVPQFSLTKQDLGSDNARSRPSCETPKKPVIRFTREQLISLRKESRVLPSMANMTDIVSNETLSPVCFSRLEPEDVIRIYNSANRDTHGRGRARGLKFNRDESDKNEKADMWDDDVPTALDTLDLAGFAEAALKFRSDTKELKSAGPNESDAVNEDVVSSLFDSKQEDEEVHTPLQSSLSANILTQTAATIVSDYPPQAASTAIASSSLEQSLFPQLNFGISSSFDIFTTNAPSIEPVEWYYRDPQNQVQGPFSQETMKVWNDDGYFTLDLPIKMGRWQQFHLFKYVFPNPSSAFIEIPSEPIQLSFPFGQTSSTISQSVKPSEAIPSNLAVDFGESIRTNDISLPQASQVVQATSKQVPTGVSTDSSVQHNSEKSDFAKKLLGIGRKKDESATVPQESKVEVDATKAVPVESKSIVETSVNKPSKGWNSQTTAKRIVSLTDIQNQQQEEMSRVEVPNVVVSPSTSAAPSSTMSFQLKNLLGVKNPVEKEDKGKTAWSTSSVADGSASSLKEIMNEELHKKQVVNVEVVPGTKASATSWAAKAKSNSPNVASATNASPKIEPTPGSMVVSKVSTDKVNSSSTANGSKSDRKVGDKSEFGGKTMSKDMAEWCSAQLKKLKGTDEAMELLQFCMSLKSSVEIREYLSQYLGSSPQVTNFATEFIKFKDGGNRPQTVEKQNDNNKFQNVTVIKKKKPQVTK